MNGQIVHRNEFGITKGTFWSPKNNYLAFYRKDESMVTDYPLLDISKRPAHISYIKYPMAGMRSEEVSVGIYNLKNGRITSYNVCYTKLLRRKVFSRNSFETSSSPILYFILFTIFYISSYNFV